MGIQHQGALPHWNYFLCLEDDIERLSRWIEFSPENESVYSIELARLLMTAAAEVDVVARALCKLIEPNARAESITSYQSVLMAAVPMLPQAIVELPRYGLSFQPWLNWKTPKTPPQWWSGNNKVKHHRSEHFKQANLRNVLNAVAGLLLLLLINYGQSQHLLALKPRLYVPKAFGLLLDEGLLLSIPHGTKLPWAS
jgi:hypothetical protein